MPQGELTAPQRAMVDTWERHLAAEFDTKSIESTMATMTADPVVNHVPVMTGGVGAREVRGSHAGTLERLDHTAEGALNGRVAGCVIEVVFPVPLLCGSPRGPASAAEE